MLKQVVSTNPTTYNGKDGVLHHLVHVVYVDGSSECVEAGSIYDPTSSNYDPVKDAE